MECMAVLKRPNVVELKTLESGGFQATVPRKPWTVWQTSRRSCSHGLFVVLVMTLLLVLLTSQLMLYSQFQQLRKQLEKNDKKISSMADQVSSEKLFKNSKHTKVNWKKKEKNEHTRRHVSQQGVGFVCRGNGLDYDGVFKWNVRHTHSYILGGLLNQDGRKFQLRDSGMYSVTVQINVKGRRGEGYLFAPVAYWICRERERADGDWSEERLDKVILTQDDRGRIIPVRGGTMDNMPVDSMPYSGVFYLAANDRLYVRLSGDTMTDNTVEFDNTAESGHFSAHLILPEH